VEELKKKIKNEYNVEEWTMGGIKKRDLVLKYLNLAGIKVQGLKKPK
jgi:DNA-directed RNA polymerase subunit H (RpoH/RPB5)